MPQIIEEREREQELIEVAGGRGGSADMLSVDVGSGFGAFLSVGAYSVRHDGNAFEEGYDSTVPTVTVGADYRITDRMLVGLAFNYFHQSGNFDSAGDFEVNAYGPILYFRARPFDGTFADASFGYTRQKNARNRRAVVADVQGDLVTSGPAPGDAYSNQFWLNISGGHDFPLQNLRIGPRVGLSVLSWQVDDYTESGATGVRLRYDDYDATSVQHSLGAAVEYPLPTSFGVVVPQLSAAWVHEYANDQQTITAGFIEAAGPLSRFAFQTEEPARDWAVINLGLSSVIAEGVQPYLNFTTVQGNENFTVYGGTVGLSLVW